MRILLVEDDIRDLKAFVQVLSDDHEVFTARSGKQALEILEDEDGDFDLVLLDVVMSGIDGWSVYVILQQRYPDLVPNVVWWMQRVHTWHSMSQLQETGNALILKPVDPWQLSQIIGWLVPA